MNEKDRIIDIAAYRGSGFECNIDSNVTKEELKIAFKTMVEVIIAHEDLLDAWSEMIEEFGNDTPYIFDETEEIN